MSFHLPTAQVNTSVVLHVSNTTLCREAAELQEAESVHLKHRTWTGSSYLYPGISVVCLDDLIRHHLHAIAMSRVRNRQDSTEWQSQNCLQHLVFSLCLLILEDNCHSIKCLFVFNASQKAIQIHS